MNWVFQRTDHLGTTGVHWPTHDIAVFCNHQFNKISNRRFKNVKSTVSFSMYQFYQTFCGMAIAPIFCVREN